ncbi:NADH-quinone oxidoreductase subunit C [Streptomyces xanthochromogenes]|uniref:Dehydrogenase n=1 Tax=Streptomyces xanthochromogenes TaxID=67384 RepID=A0ABQ3A0S4_9ACTN|nr:NADH-quinone oxidoreductase subunit C [Streptomyces xanthochromogenes]GGY31328.1 dehydrogenase [Streptomyces xanthochromogenes]
MTAYDTLPDGVTEIFGAEATAEEAYGLLTVDVPAGSWIAALEIARDKLGCTYFDWLSAVDEPGSGFRICAHVVSLGEGRVRRLLVRTTVPHSAPVLASAIDVYAGAAWHERETHEMFGVDFTDHPHLVPLLLPENFEGHPLRKDFVLAARVAKAWPGAKEPGESEHGGPKRRQMLPPGVPDPNEWGPLKGQLPPAPARPARTSRAAGAAGAERPARAAGERPVRRARSVSEGSASQATPAGTEGGVTPAAQEGAVAPEPAPSEAPAVRPRRTRTASEGSASQTTPAAPESPAAPAAPAPEGPGAPAAPEAPGPVEAADAPQAPAARPRRSRSASEGSASQQGGDAEKRAAAPPRTRSSDAPWHSPKPAFGEEEPAAKPAPAPAAEEPEPHDPAEPTDPAGGEPRE